MKYRKVSQGRYIAYSDRVLNKLVGKIGLLFIIYYILTAAILNSVST